MTDGNNTRRVIMTERGLAERTPGLESIAARREGELPSRHLLTEDADVTAAAEPA